MGARDVAVALRMIDPIPSDRLADITAGISAPSVMVTASSSTGRRIRLFFIIPPSGSYGYPTSISFLRLRLLDLCSAEVT